MRLLGAFILIFGMIGLMLAAYISIVGDLKSTKIAKKSELVSWDYKLTVVKQFTGHPKLYQGKSGECYLKVSSGTAMGLTVVNCNDFMEINNG